MIRLDLREPKNLITFTWENINVYAKKKASCLAKMTGKAKEEAIHIVKNGNDEFNRIILIFIEVVY